MWSSGASPPAPGRIGAPVAPPKRRGSGGGGGGGAALARARRRWRFGMRSRPVFGGSSGPEDWSVLMASVNTPGPVSSSVYVGSRGRTGTGYLNFATIASKVARIAECPLQETITQLRY